MYSVVFSSKTGNTRGLAEKILEALPEEECAFIGEAREDGIASASYADVIFAGFWTDKGTCSRGMQEFLTGLENKKIVLFGTAGFGGSEEYYNKIMESVKTFLPSDCEVLGTYMCPGKMPIGVLKRYDAMLLENPENQQAKMMVENYHNAASHPDREDEKKLKELVKSIYSAVKGEN